MKKRYEKKQMMIFMCISFFLIEFLFILFLVNRKIVVYQKFVGVVSKDDVLVFLLSDEELDLFYKNKNIYIKNKKKKFLIKEVYKDVLERNGVFYNQVFLEINISSMYKVNDTMDVSVAKHSIKSINIFKIIWEGE